MSEVKLTIDNAPTVELTASFMRQQAEDELIRIRVEADQRGYQRGYNWGLEVGKHLKQPTGKWIYDEKLCNWKCSNCLETPKTIGYVGSSEFMIEHFKYCNHCGLKIEGVEK